jgi:cysteine-rich repeat protein
VITVFASPVPLAAAELALGKSGPRVVNYLLVDLSRSTSLVQTLSADTYGDPFPASWPRVLEIDYQRTRTMAAPGSTTPDELHFGFGTRQHVAFTGAVDPPPPLSPPTGIRLAGAAFSAGGKIMFDGHSPVEVQWNPVAGASSYRLDVEVWAIDPEFPDAGFVVNSVAAFRTVDTSLRLPASVFTAESFYLFGLQAIQAGNDYRGGHLIPPPAPPQTATVPSGRFRFTATCGDGVMQPGEDCDDRGESAHCNIDCTVAACGDGLRNATAGEACDDGTDTLECNRNCTRPSCGDGRINDTLEDCDDGNATDDGNGCSANCKFNNVCGNHIVERIEEGCDEGGVDTPTCDSDCTPVQCGDGHVNAAAGEECDDGLTINGTGHCSKTCKLQ